MENVLQASMDVKRVYDFFNREMFDNELPNVIFNFDRKYPKSLGYFRPQIWSENKSSEEQTEALDEITINPIHMENEDDKSMMSTLVHEMCHVWHFHFGNDKALKNQSHNKIWGNKMKEIGLYPSSTGEVGGKETGKKMMEYVIENGLFDKIYKTNSDFLKFNIISIEGIELKIKKDKEPQPTYKYICPSCGQILKTKERSEDIICGKCSDIKALNFIKFIEN